MADPIWLLKALTSKERFARYAGRSSRRAMIIAAVLSVVAAIGLIGTASYLASLHWRDAQLLQRGVVAKGWVTAVANSESWRQPRYSVTVGYGFKDATSNTHAGRAHRNFHDLPPIKTGDIIDVIYDPQQPELSNWRVDLAKESTSFELLSLLLGCAAVAAFGPLIARQLQWFRAQSTVGRG